MTDKEKYLYDLEDEVIRQRYDIRRLGRQIVDMENTIELLEQLGEENEVFMYREMRKRDNKGVFLLPMKKKRGKK